MFSQRTPTFQDRKGPAGGLLFLFLMRRSVLTLELSVEPLAPVVAVRREMQP